MDNGSIPFPVRDGVPVTGKKSYPASDLTDIVFDSKSRAFSHQFMACKLTYCRPFYADILAAPR
jgi:hypothetical protein